MTRCVILLKLWLFSLIPAGGAWAIESTTSPIPSVCERRDSSVFQALTRDRSQRMGFTNEGGIAGQGVCWWHSRFQRAAWSLIEFRPDLPVPTAAEAEAIIDDLAHLRRVVIVPGFSDLQTFTRYFKSMIQRELGQWQTRDGILGGAWMRGLARKSSFDRPERAYRVMKKLYSEYKRDRAKNRVTWVKLQMPGITAHAALVIDMDQDSDENFQLRVVDSNYPMMDLSWTFHRGDRTLKVQEHDEIMMPYAGFDRDYRKIERAVAEYCSASAQ